MDYLQITLPSAQASSSGQVLANNGSGTLSWATINTSATSVYTDGTTITGNGSNNTNQAITLNLANANTWTATQTFAPTADQQGAVIEQSSAAGTTSDIFDIESSNGNTKFLSVGSGGQLTLAPVGNSVVAEKIYMTSSGAGDMLDCYGRPAGMTGGPDVALVSPQPTNNYVSEIVGNNTTPGVFAGAIGFNDGGSHALAVTVATQSGNYLDTIPNAGANTSFIMANTASSSLTQTLTSPLFIVDNDFQIGDANASPAAMSGHIKAGGPSCSLASLVAGATTGGTATDVAGVVSLALTTTSIGGCGAILKIKMNANYNSTNGVAIVVNGVDCSSNALLPFGTYVVNGWAAGTDAILIWVTNGNGGVENVTYKFQYHVIEVQ